MTNLYSARIIFMGTSDFGVPVLKAIFSNNSHILMVISQPDRPRGRNQNLTPTAIKTAAQQMGLPIYQPEKIRSAECFSRLSSLAPDLIITASYGQILLQKHLDIPRFGVINVHASLLPEFRGASPIQSAIIEGKPHTGCTIMLTEKGIDSGPILATKTIEIQQDDTAGSLQQKLSFMGAELLIETLPLYIQGDLKPVVQDPAKATYTKQLFPKDGWIDWTKSAIELSRQIRGMNPCPGAYTSCRNQRLKIHFAQQLSSAVDTTDQPGTITGCINGKGLLVQTGKGMLLCEELQPACRKRMKGDNLLQGRFASLGEVLGQQPFSGDSVCHE